MLSTEATTLAKANLDQQQHFSDKMLDTIIGQNKFGEEKLSDSETKSETIEEIIEKRLNVIEKKIGRSVENKIKEMISSGITDPIQIETELQSIRADLSKFKEEASAVSTELQIPKYIKKSLS
ncbi:MAG: hypothetical protein IIA59_03555 [Candidatus Marinimicrobia bacterium]|nr:hypothetical protein [Candidatus Neomarinimicrobiota bacterium]